MSRDSARVPVPGSYVNPAFVEPEIVEQPLDDAERQVLEALGFPGDAVRWYTMGGQFTCMRVRVPAGKRGRLLTALMITGVKRVASWDEIKFARYSLLPADRWFALLLPPPELYVDDLARSSPFRDRLNALLSQLGARTPPAQNIMLWEVEPPFARKTPGERPSEVHRCDACGQPWDPWDVG